MPRCQFIYLRARGNNITGGQCDQEAKYVDHTLCLLHHNRKQSHHNPEGIDNPTVNNTFPRQYSEQEIESWVNEARQRTSPKYNQMLSCVSCGLSVREGDMNTISLSDLKILKSLTDDFVEEYYRAIPASLFTYDEPHSALNGTPLEPEAFLSANELATGATSFSARSCRDCFHSIQKHEVPRFALCSGLWTGVGLIPSLSDLTWIEEKLIAKVHVSIQVQKCRMFRSWHIDGFHPQRQLQGHILTFPMDPTVVLHKLPLRPNQLMSLIKVVFVSRQKPPSMQEVNNLRFFVIRQKKVYAALMWLIENNPHYKDIQLDISALGALPEDGVASEVYNTITFSRQVQKHDQGHSRYDALDPEDRNGTDGTHHVFYIKLS